MVCGFRSVSGCGRSVLVLLWICVFSAFCKFGLVGCCCFGGCLGFLSLCGVGII